MNQVARRNNGGALTAAPNKEPNMTSIPMYEPFDTIVYAKGKDSCLAGRYLGERPIAIHHANLTRGLTGSVLETLMPVAHH